MFRALSRMHRYHTSIYLRDTKGLAHITVTGAKNNNNKQFDIWHHTVAPGAGTPIHTHPGQEEFILVLAGTATFYLQDTDGSLVTHTGGPNTTITILPDVRHQIVNLGTEAFSTLAVLGDPPARITVFPSWDAEGGEGTAMNPLWDRECPDSEAVGIMDLVNEGGNGDRKKATAEL